MEQLSRWLPPDRLVPWIEEAHQVAKILSSLEEQPPSPQYQRAFLGKARLLAIVPSVTERLPIIIRGHEEEQGDKVINLMQVPR